MILSGVIEFFQSVDDDGADGIAHDVGGGAEHIEEGVHCEYHGDVFNGEADGVGDQDHSYQAGVGDGSSADAG